MIVAVVSIACLMFLFAGEPRTEKSERAKDIWQVFYASTRPRSKHRVCLYGERAYFELSVLTIYCRNYTFQPVERDKVQTTYNYLDLGVGLGQLPLLLV